MARDTRSEIPHLRAWRLYRLLSPGDLAKAADVGRDTIFRLERPGQRANELTVYKIARALDINAKQLLEEMPPEKGRANGHTNSAE